MARIAALSCAFFVAVVLLIPVLDDGDYTAGTSTISEGVLVRFGWLQTVAFLVLGIGSVLLAYMLRGLWTSRRGVAATALIAVWGVAVVVSGIFPVDEGVKGETTAAVVHLTAASVAFVALLVAMWLASFAFRGYEAWSSWSTASIITSAVATVAFIVMAAAPQESSWGGYAQRGFVVVVLAWLAGVALVADGRGRSRRDDPTDLTASLPEPWSPEAAAPGAQAPRRGSGSTSRHECWGS